MTKKIIILIIAFLAVGTLESPAQNFLRELGKRAEQSIRNAVREESGKSKKQGSPTSRQTQTQTKNQAQSQPAPVAKPKLVLPPATHSAFLEPIGYICNDGKTTGTGTVPPKSESGQAAWINAQPPVTALTNESAAAEYKALKEWHDKANFTIKEAVASRMYALDNELTTRAKAISDYVAGLKKSSEAEVVRFAKLLSGDAYKRAVNSSIAPLKPYFSEDVSAYFEPYGNLQDIHLAEKTSWYPYAETEKVSSSVEGLVGEINLDGMADLGGLIFRLYPELNRQKNIAVLNSTHAKSLEGKDITIPSHIIRNGVSYSVIEIAAGTFYSNAMKSLVLPGTLKKVGNNAFANMAYVQTLIIPAGVTELGAACFHDSPELVEVHIPDSVTRIGGGCFANCPKLTTVTLPKSVKHFDIGQFDNCPSLVKVNLPENIKEIKTRMFRGCKSLVSIEIPASVEVISGNAFEGCSKLADIKFPSVLREIKDDAFEGCLSLKSIVIPASVRTLGSGVFNSCAALASVVIEGAETEFDSFPAFEGCKSLKSVTMNAKYNDTRSLYVFYESAVYPRDKSPLMNAFHFVG